MEKTQKIEISVIVPMYNARNSIVQTLDSVKRQTYDHRKLEVIVVNDGSNDDSSQLLTEYLLNNETDITFTLIEKENGGASSARNMGLKNAKGEWIALLDSDDEWISQKLQRQLEVLKKHPEIDFLGTTRNSERINWIFWKKFSVLTKVTIKNLLLRFVFVVPTVIFKRKIVNDIGFFDESLRYAEEGNYFMRIASKYNCYLLNESLVLTGGGKAHFGESGLSGNIKEMEKGELRNIKFAKQQGWINYLEYFLVTAFSLSKYLRRIIIVKFKK